MIMTKAMSNLLKQNYTQDTSPTVIFQQLLDKQLTIFCKDEQCGAGRMEIKYYFFFLLSRRAPSQVFCFKELFNTQRFIKNILLQKSFKVNFA